MCCLNMGKIVSSFWERHIHNLISERDQTWKGGSRIFVKHGCHRRQPSPSWKVLHFGPPPTPWHVMSVNYEQPFDELTVQVWLFYDHPNFKHVQVGRNYVQTDWKTDGRTMQLIDNPGIPFRQGGIKRRLPNVCCNLLFYLFKSKYKSTIPSWLLLWPHISGISEKCVEEKIVIEFLHRFSHN